LTRTAKKAASRFPRPSKVYILGAFNPRWLSSVAHEKLQVSAELVTRLKRVGSRQKFDSEDAAKLRSGIYVERFNVRKLLNKEGEFLTIFKAANNRIRTGKMAGVGRTDLLL